ncbi:MAG: AhpC/TSA family protein [Prevotellaceae bacterium]|jgi:thiol-disulfide isomerase/thioredoxin|nr:AhpC/TSA family protein [Prevotellaceae bacterium]
MKNFLCVLTLIFAFVACGVQKGSYVIGGTVEGASDGDTVFLSKVIDGMPETIGTAIVLDGTFTFTGETDTIVPALLSAAQGQLMDFLLLERGSIEVELARFSRITGTPLNNAYQDFRNRFNECEQRYATATESERESINEEALGIIRSAVRKNIGTPLGLLLLQQYYRAFSLSDLAVLTDEIPDNLQSDSFLVQLKAAIDQESANTATLEATGEGKPFIDLTMQTPEGNSIRLSDYVGKGKYVLVDFWASWCAPCRVETPKLVELYKKYAGKNFEIVGISFDRPISEGGLEAWRNGIKELNITWPQMSDLKYWNSEAVRVYGVRSIPHLILFDPAGTVVVRGLRADAMSQRVAELLQ